MTKLLSILSILSLTACNMLYGTPAEPSVAYSITLTAQDGKIATVEVGGDGTADIPTADRVEPILRYSAYYWGRDVDSLDGIHLGFHAGDVSGLCDDSGKVLDGCAYPNVRVIWVNTESFAGCPERLVPHEVGHLEIDDADVGHTDPRWRTVANVWTMIAWGIGHQIPGCP
jgi:hypothetical protein